MIYTQDELLKLILDTRAVSIWDHNKGPVFWYAGNVPGPFYVNTEMVIGATLAEKTLQEMTTIVAGTIDAEARAVQLNRLILDSYKTNAPWQKLIATLVAKAKEEFSNSSFTMISGGERRDWLFSIPFAHATSQPHLFLFKNKTIYSEHPVKPDSTVLHLSDLINNAASFFDLWQPTLQSVGIQCCGNLCINIRGNNGLQRLRAAGQKTVGLVTIDIDFFRRLHATDLLDRNTFEEIAVFFASPQEWATKYLIGKPELFNAPHCDGKSFERLRHFIIHDPWNLRSHNEEFFLLMNKLIDQRLSRAA